MLTMYISVLISVCQQSFVLKKFLWLNYFHFVIDIKIDNFAFLICYYTDSPSAHQSIKSRFHCDVNFRLSFMII